MKHKGDILNNYLSKVTMHSDMAIENISSISDLAGVLQYPFLQILLEIHWQIYEDYLVIFFSRSSHDNYFSHDVETASDIPIRRSSY